MTLDNNDPMPFGKFTGTKMNDIPDWWWKSWYFFAKDKSKRKMPPDHFAAKMYYEREILNT